ncbi:MAG: type II toxin-antitoxin system VapC family toxin, partial [Pontimonas sp.]
CSALRRHEVRLERSLDADFGTLLRIPWNRVPFSVFSPLTWALRHEVSLYDAAYVALAMALGVPLVTTDRKLARASTRYCQVVIPGE